VKDALKWLFTDPAGAFALACIALGICSVTWLVLFFAFGPGPATPVAVACGSLFQLFLTKIRA
jgi:hypothetical protein